jgi:hypothetical protein
LFGLEKFSQLQIGALFVPIACIGYLVSTVLVLRKERQLAVVTPAA